MTVERTQVLEQPASRQLAVQSHFILLLATALPGICLLAFQQARFWPFFIDDSYISLVYVRNFLEGQSLTYNGLAVEGYSNFLWVIGVILLSLTGLDPVLAAKLFGVFCGHACILAIVELGYLLSGRWRDGLLAGLLLALTGPFIAWSVGGLEGCLLALLLVLLVRYLLLEQQLPTQRWSWSAVVALLLAMTRPEAIGLVAIVWAWLVLQAVLKQRSWGGLVSWTLTFALGFGLFLSWRYLMYQDFLPAPVYAKRSALQNQINTGVLRLSPLLSEWNIILATLSLGVAGYLIGAWAKRWIIALMAGLVVCYCAFAVVAGGDWMPMHRYLVPIMPLAALLIGGGSVALIERFAPTLPVAARSLLAAAIVVAPLYQIGSWTEQRRQGALATARSTWDTPMLLGTYLAKINDGSTSIALIDAGAIAYYSGIPAIDLYGLNNRHIAHLPGVSGDRLDLNYLFAAKPTFFELHHRFTPRGNPIFVNFSGSPKLFYTREFQRWYERVPEIPLSPFRRRAEPLATTMFDDFYAAKLAPQDQVLMLAAGRLSTIPIEIVNQGTGIWVADNALYGGVVYVVARLLEPDSGAILSEEWTPLLQDMLPGERQLLDLRVKALGQAGNYLLEIDMVLNDVAFFSQQGYAASRYPLVVQ